MRAVMLDTPRPRLVTPIWRPEPRATVAEEELWMQNEDVVSAWAVSALTGAAVALLVVLAVLG